MLSREHSCCSLSMRMALPRSRVLVCGEWVLCLFEWIFFFVFDSPTPSNGEKNAWLIPLYDTPKLATDRPTDEKKNAIKYISEAEKKNSESEWARKKTCASLRINYFTLGIQCTHTNRLIVYVFVVVTIISVRCYDSLLLAHFFPASVFYIIFTLLRFFLRAV